MEQPLQPSTNVNQALQPQIWLQLKSSFSVEFR